MYHSLIQNKDRRPTPRLRNLKLRVSTTAEGVSVSGALADELHLPFEKNDLISPDRACISELEKSTHFIYGGRIGD